VNAAARAHGLRLAVRVVAVALRQARSSRPASGWRARGRCQAVSPELGAMPGSSRGPSVVCTMSIVLSIVVGRPGCCPGATAPLAGCSPSSKPKSTGDRFRRKSPAASAKGLAPLGVGIPWNWQCRLVAALPRIWKAGCRGPLMSSSAHKLVPFLSGSDPPPCRRSCDGCRRKCCDEKARVACSESPAECGGAPISCADCWHDRPRLPRRQRAAQKCQHGSK
jgi:hypothetical protein